MKLKMMYSFLNSDINTIEKQLEETIQANSLLLKQASCIHCKPEEKEFVLFLFCLLVNLAIMIFNVMKNVAVALELIHMASLVHDDVIDDAEIRRGKPTIKAKWDNRIAMYTGDYIFALSLDMMTNIKNQRRTKFFQIQLLKYVLGRLQQIKDKYRFDQNFGIIFAELKEKRLF